MTTLYQAARGKGEAYFFLCFSLNRQPHTRDQRPRKEHSCSVLGPNTRRSKIQKKNKPSTRGMLKWQRNWSYPREKRSICLLSLIAAQPDSSAYIGFCIFKCTVWRSCKAPIVFSGTLKLQSLVSSTVFILPLFFAVGRIYEPESARNKKVQKVGLNLYILLSRSAPLTRQKQTPTRGCAEITADCCSLMNEVVQ